MQTKQTLKENWEIRIFDIICLLVGAYYENSYFIQSKK